MKRNHRRRIFIAFLVMAFALLATARMTFPIVGEHPGETVSAAPVQPACIIRGKPATDNNDPLARFLRAQKPCPFNVFDFRAQLTAAGAKLKPTLVANRGFHNRKSQADGMHFMMFEMISGQLKSLNTEIKDGEFFFGHFTVTNGTTLQADQSPARGSLMIELIAWDATKEVFNFYELIGDGSRGQWFYRGDSVDIQQDVRLLHRQAIPATQLRCSGCHVAGGPIMKELAAPHNDWWTNQRKLPFGKLKPDAQLNAILQDLVDADELAVSVKAGLQKLAGSAKFQQAKKALSLPEQLRPLFCPVELNLESDPVPFDDRAAQLNIPSAFFVNPLLAQGSVSVRREHYDAALTALNFSSLETSPKRLDADHGWLTPVKAASDLLAIETLIEQGLIDREFALDVLAVDLTNPLFSAARCGLLRLLPETAEGDWQKKFQAALKAAPRDPAAQELLNNLTNPARNVALHQERATNFLQQCREHFQTAPEVADLLRLLAQRRAEVLTSKISKIPGGEILEPGFRVIFPLPAPRIPPPTSHLTEDGRVVRP